MKNIAEIAEVDAGLSPRSHEASLVAERTAPSETIWLDDPTPSSRWKKAVSTQVARIAIIVAALALWEFISGRWVDEFWISKPSAIWDVLWGWISTGDILIHLQATVTEMALGLFFGAIGGIAVGFLLGRVEWLANLLDPIVNAVYSLPKVALAPLFILWFGVDLLSKVVLTAVVCFFLVFYNTYAGVRDVDKDLVDVVRVMGGSRRDILQKVVLPSAATWIYTGLRLAVPYALIGAVVGEIVASNKGLGFLLARAAGTFNTSATFAALFILMLIGTLLNYLVDMSEKRTGRRTS
ncbi:ABC transporter permease [Rhodococcus rhodochrous]|uniref:ABC transporter permease n=1 Tax=Rhodococcus rhodochrous TaxID=1829 RepID=UPI0002DBA97B|nr:ABC transporter permease [Rhodococcus rhodochrous]